MPKPATLPMPVEIVLCNPVVISASGPAYRLILSLAVVFWGGGCRPLPADDAGLCALARCGASTWRKDGRVARDALGQILPQLERHYSRVLQRAEIYRKVKAEAGRKGAAARWQTPTPSVKLIFGKQDEMPRLLRTPARVANGRAPAWLSNPATPAAQVTPAGRLTDD